MRILSIALLFWAATAVADVPRLLAPPALPGANQFSPAITTDGVSSLVVWRESEGASHSLRAVVINSFGAAVSKAVTLSDHYSLRPQVAFGGGLYLVI